MLGLGIGEALRWRRKMVARGSIGEGRNAVEDGIVFERERRNHELNSKLVFPRFCRYCCRGSADFFF